MTTVSPMGAARIAEQLQKTSRTFALAIPLLPEPCRQAVALAYLAFRVADTLEDAAEWTLRERVTALNELCALLHPGQAEASRAHAKRWVEARPLENEAYLALLAELPELLAAMDALDPEPRRLVYEHARRTSEGMAQLQQQHNVRGQLELRTVEDLRKYCYVVAGIVGELLTELFVTHAPGELAGVADALRKDQVAFGEALQLVNIVKDQSVDVREGRSLIPESVPRPQVIALAREDLTGARRYVQNLRDSHAPSGMVAFTQLPLELAEASLREVEQHGPGAKVSRAHVQELFAKAKGLLAPPQA